MILTLTALMNVCNLSKETTKVIVTDYANIFEVIKKQMVSLADRIVRKGITSADIRSLIRLISCRKSNLSLICLHIVAVKVTDYSARQAGMSIDELDVPCRPKVAL
jgi:hypothetical protein